MHGCRAGGRTHESLDVAGRADFNGCASRDFSTRGRDPRPADAGACGEQASAVDPSRLGELVGHLAFGELRAVDAALRLVMSL